MKRLARLLVMCALIATLGACGRPLPKPGKPVVPRSAVTGPHAPFESVSFRGRD